MSAGKRITDAQLLNVAKHIPHLQVLTEGHALEGGALIGAAQPKMSQAMMHVIRIAADNGVFKGKALKEIMEAMKMTKSHAMRKKIMKGGSFKKWIKKAGKWLLRNIVKPTVGKALPAAVSLIPGAGPVAGTLAGLAGQAISKSIK